MKFTYAACNNLIICSSVPQPQQYGAQNRFDRLFHLVLVEYIRNASLFFPPFKFMGIQRIAQTSTKRYDLTFYASESWKVCLTCVFFSESELTIVLKMSKSMIFG